MKDDDKIVINIDMKPVSTNRIWLQNYQTKRTYLNPEYRAFRQYTAIKVGRMRIPEKWPFCAVKIIVHPKRRIGDADNYTKGILDSLTHAGFWKDDKVVANVESGFGAPCSDPWVQIVIERRETKFSDTE